MFLIFIILFVWLLKIYFSAMKISLKLNKKLKETGKISEKYFDSINYTKMRLPWGSFSKNYDNFYDEDDTEKIKEIKSLAILTIKKFNKILIFVLLDVFILILVVFLR
ncbi:hypothetical protein [Arcobacter sp. CECT 8989]|uniref:hypothetical protein n=1 Tax=Arcobacter sp. CECT 8989 TaxID=2044509 RepID=UPI00100A2787|nr:hypothetical protein [Arcobacter sp. CECT 8989]